MKVRLQFESDKPGERERGTTIFVYLGGQLISELDGRDEPPEIVLENVNVPINIERRFRMIPHPGTSGAAIENATQR